MSTTTHRPILVGGDAHDSPDALERGQSAERLTDDEVLFSRTGTTHPLGKLICPRKTDLPELVDQRLADLARNYGMTMAEAMREVMCWALCGPEMEKITLDRARVFGGMGAGIERGGRP